MSLAGIYNGWNGKRYETFRSPTPPTRESHGHAYGFTIGPFRTMRGARFHAEHGMGNPHITCVADAERIAKEIAA